jgi:polyisoprenoid-binding protein YceI
VLPVPVRVVVSNFSIRDRCSKRSGHVSLPLAMFLLTGLLSIGTAQAETSRYILDSGASRMVIQVGKAGLFGFAGHEHEIVASSIAGTVDVDPEHVGAASVELTFNGAGLRVTGKGEPAADVPKVQEAMLGPRCLDVARFPAIRFVAKAISVKRSTAGRHELEIRGDMTLHGVTRELTVPVEVRIDHDHLTVSGRTVIRQKDFNITPISVAGVVKVKNEIVLEWLLVGNRAR